MRTIKITCKGCWRIVALGLSFRMYKERVMDKNGEVLGQIERPYPAHDEEECPHCGTVHDCGPADFWHGHSGSLMSDRDARDEPLGEPVRFIYRGFIEGPIPVQDPTQFLPEADPLEEQWLE